MKQEVATVGLDLAKNVFQVHAIGSDGAVIIRRKLRRKSYEDIVDHCCIAWNNLVDQP